MKNRILSILLIIAMTVSFAPVTEQTDAVSLTVTRQWTVDPPSAGVATIGTGNHVLKLAADFTDEEIAALSANTGGNLQFTYRTAHDSNRYILAWTDLSGTQSQVETFEFATSSNRTAGRVVRTSSHLPAGTMSARLTLPSELLYDSATGKAATAIYVIFTTYNDSNHLSSNQRGGSSRSDIGVNKEFDLFAPVSLSATASICETCNILPCICVCPSCGERPCVCVCEYCAKITCNGECVVETTFTHINIAPGQDPAKLGFSWFVPSSHTSTAAVVQIVESRQLAEGQMPANPAQFTGIVEEMKSVNGESVTAPNKSAKVTVTGLNKNTEYAYRVGDGTNWSHIYKVKTQDPDSSYTALAVADPQVSSSNTDWARTLKVATKKNPNAAFILTAGDNIARHNDPNRTARFASPPQLRKYPVAAACGNHDTNDRESSFPDIMHLRYLYQYPENARIIGSGHSGAYSYYFVYGDVLYIMLNSNVGDAHPQNNPHKPIMDEAVETYPDTKWRIAVYHHDIYGGASHASGMSWMRENWSRMMSEYKIDLVINGHDHFYTRSKFMDTNAAQTNQMSAVFNQDFARANPAPFIRPNGTPYITLNPAGNPGYRSLSSSTTGWLAYYPSQNSKPEYTTLTVDGDSITLKTFRNTTGEEYNQIDSITLRKKALREDLNTMLPGAETITNNSYNTDDWSVFQSSITAARVALNDIKANADEIHFNYVKVYSSYFALTKTSQQASCQHTNFTAITCVKNGEVGVKCNATSCKLNLMKSNSANPCALCKKAVCSDCNSCNTLCKCDFVPDYLYIGAVDFETGWLEICNPTDRAIPTKGLYLSDDSNLLKWKMPLFIVKQGKSILVRGDSNNSTVVLKRAQTNFFVTPSVEIIYLSDAAGNILDVWSG